MNKARLTRKQFVTDFIDMTKKIAVEHGMTYDELLLAYAVAHGGVVRVAEGLSTTWEVSFDYGPHMSDTVKVKARSKEEAIAKIEKAEKKRGRNIMINWAEIAK